MRIQTIPIEKLTVSKFNTRKDLQAGQIDSDIDSLASDISKNGLHTPLIVRPGPEGVYEVICGQRRLLACQKIGMRHVPCNVRDDLDDEGATIISLGENVHRADMNPMDKARALRSLLMLHDGSVRRVAEVTNCSTTTIRNYLTLTNLPDELQEKLSSNEGHGRVMTMVALGKNFSGEDAIAVHEKIAGFTGKIQREILRQSRGDFSRIADLVVDAHEGVFDARQCGGTSGCEIVRDIINGDVSQADFQRQVNEMAAKKKSIRSKAEVRIAARALWQSLARD